MKTIQMTIDELLLANVDQAVDELGTSRSAFIRDALQAALRRHAVAKLESRHAAGYAAQPLGEDEEDDWEPLRGWGEP